MTLRKGLNSWDAARDAAMGTGLDASIDIPNDQSLNMTEQSGTLDFLSHSMRLEPRREEAGVVSKLNEQIQTLMRQSYGDIDDTIEEFFERVQDFNKMEVLELERTILSIQGVIYLATDVVTSLYNDAYFADRVQQDEYWAAYKSLDGKATIGDRQAHAYEATRDSRFFYYYSYLLWKRMSEKLSALRDLQKTLEWFRSRTQKDRPF
jgi:hypothetical protein